MITRKILSENDEMKLMLTTMKLFFLMMKENMKRNQWKWEIKQKKINMEDIMIKEKQEMDKVSKKLIISKVK